MKLGTYLVRYIHEPDATQMTLSALESVVQLTREDVRRSLAILQSFSFITSFTMERDGIHVAMRLSQLQQIRVLETRSRRDRAIAERCTARSVGATNQSWIAPAAIPQPEAANEQAPKAA